VILRFLRLFSAFTDLEESLRMRGMRLEQSIQDADRYRQEMESARSQAVLLEASVASLQRENDYLRGKCDQWERDYKEANEKRQTATEMVADFESLRLHGRTIYGRVPAAPPAPKLEPGSLGPQKMHMRQAIQMEVHRKQAEAQKNSQQEMAKFFSATNAVNE